MNYVSYLVRLAVQWFGWCCWHRGDTGRKRLRGRGGGEGNTSYSRDLDSVKINLHEIELIYLILKAKETSGLST